MERFTWNEEEHRPYFPKLAENIALQKESAQKQYELEAQKKCDDNYGCDFKVTKHE